MNEQDEVFKCGVYPSRDHNPRRLETGRLFKTPQMGIWIDP
jgi:hypothetical protein